MPRQFEHQSTYPVPPSHVHAAFTDGAYWRARIEAVGGAGASIDELTEREGGLAVELTQIVAAQHLPPVVANLMNGDLRISRTEAWGPLTADAATAEGTATVRGTPATVVISSSLTGDDEGSTVRTTGQVRVSVPLIGGRIEQTIADNVTRLLVAEQNFTQEWLTR